MRNTEKLIKRVDNYLRFMRYSYVTQEKLNRLNAINDYYLSLNKKPTTEKLSSKVDFIESLGKLALPLKVKGVFLHEGRHAVKFYSAEELEKSALNPVNKSFPLMLDHQNKDAGKIVGKVDKIEYDDSVKGIRWWGHVNDETTARNILDGLIKEVSATIDSITEYDDEYGVVGTDLVYDELSFVRHAADGKAFVELD